MANTELSKTEFSNLLKQANKPTHSVDLTDKIMGEINTISIKNKVYEKYIHRSWVFIGLAIILGIKGVSVLSYFESSFSQVTNGLFPGLSEIITYTTLSAFAGLVFYQLNNLLSQRITN